MCYQKLKTIVSQDKITPILAEYIIINDPTNLGEFGGPDVDAVHQEPPLAIAVVTMNATTAVSIRSPQALVSFPNR
ncbi:hypothetical protein BPAE_0269g00130 [Botrytis paeoniae]|uniref:Uncharacterized protein n=1 Tax=Botrytis paeoniae TaxID=278948 RepID=A0A4Z1FD81_9HELO|nr:hypothetical protein BPAE_0269g00130 [Botrytis paeoniae]